MAVTLAGNRLGPDVNLTRIAEALECHPTDLVNDTGAAPDPATGAPDPARMLAFVEAHPESLTAVQAAKSLRIFNSPSSSVPSGRGGKFSSKLPFLLTISTSIRTVQVSG